jgi:hypothetical protein
MPVLVLYEFITWLYGDGMREFTKAWLNLHWFLWRVFSVPLLLRTFFAPFRRTSEGYGRGFDPSRIAETFMINMVTRMVGALVKTVLLAVAIVFNIALFAVGVIALALFIASPVVIPASALVALIIIVT